MSAQHHSMPEYPPYPPAIIAIRDGIAEILGRDDEEERLRMERYPNSINGYPVIYYKNVVVEFGLHNSTIWYCQAELDIDYGKSRETLINECKVSRNRLGPSFDYIDQDYISNMIRSIREIVEMPYYDYVTNRKLTKADKFIFGIRRQRSVQQ